MTVDLHRKFIEAMYELEIINQASFLKLQRRFSKENGCSFLQKDELLKVYQKMLKDGTIKRHIDLERVIQMKNVRSQSGIAVVSVLTKPFPCPGQCIFCPTENGVPKSYLSNEPAVMRAIANGYHPYKQVQSRLKALRDTGHNIDKITIRIIGGSWSSYSHSYQSWFIRQLFRACNDFSLAKKTTGGLAKLQEINESAESRIVELSIETRPDMVNKSELLRLRSYGVTKVELGVQSIDDEVLRLNKRGTDTSATISATKLLKDFGFKVSYQMMLNLYGSSPALDIKVFKEIFKCKLFRPDHLKIYPLALVANSALYEIHQQGGFTPYDKETLIKLLSKIKQSIPKYCRVERVIRDIPASHIVEGGASVSNLRQEVEKALSTKGKSCQCIRCREIKGHQPTGEVGLHVNQYEASFGEEFFVYVSDTQDRLIGFLRLRISDNRDVPNALKHSAIIREIHVYGPSVKIGKRREDAQQHLGYGKMMIKAAEQIARDHSKKKIAVIAGVGVRAYFRTQGYNLENSYMTKEI